MTSKLEAVDFFEKLINAQEQLSEIKTKIDDPAFMAGGGQLSEEEKKAEEDKREKFREQMELKIDAAFEKVRNDNMYIWKQSIQLAEKEFAQKGVGETMNFLPKLLFDRTDLKRTINTLILEEEQHPKPLVLPEHLQVPRSQILGIEEDQPKPKEEGAAQQEEEKKEEPEV